MKLKKIIAAFAAAAVAVSAMAVSAFAAITNPTDGGKYVVTVGDVLGDKAADVYGFEVSVTVTGDGDLGVTAQNTSWVDWTHYGTNADTGEAKLVEDGVIKYVKNYALFDADGIAAGTAQIYIEGWGAEFSVDSIKYLDQNGNEIVADAAATTETTEATETTETTSSETGNVSAAVILSVMAAAGVAAIAAKKRK